MMPDRGSEKGHEPIVQVRARGQRGRGGGQGLRADRPRSQWSTAAFVLVAVALLALVPYLLLRPRDRTYVLREYEVAAVTRADVQEVVTSSGTLTSALARAVYAPAGGSLTQLAVSDGDTVAQGALLARLDAPELQLNRSRARDALLKAQDDGAKALRDARTGLDTARVAADQAAQALPPAEQAARTTAELFAAGAASRNDLSAAQDKASSARRDQEVAGRKLRQAQADLTLAQQSAARQLRAAQDDLSRAEQALERLNVRAPIAGRVSGLSAEVGQNVASGTQLMSVSSLAQVQVELQLPEDLATRVRAGQAARVTVGEQVLEGEVARVAASAKAASAQAAPTVAATVRFVTPPREPRLGGNAEVALTLATKRDVPTLPRGAFLSTGGERLAYVVRPGDTAERREVVYGIQSDDLVEVVSGLEPGETVITSSYEAYKDQAVVRVSPGGQRGTP